MRKCLIELICLSAVYADLQTWPMCLSTVILSERMKPRLRAEVEKETSEEQTEREDGFGQEEEKEREL